MLHWKQDEVAAPPKMEGDAGCRLRTSGSHRNHKRKETEFPLETLESIQPFTELPCRTSDLQHSLRDKSVLVQATQT